MPETARIYKDSEMVEFPPKGYLTTFNGCIDGSDSSRVCTRFVNANGYYGNLSVVYNVGIRENDDLDDYTITGHYTCITDSIAASLSNCPVSNRFTLLVTRSGVAGEVVQTLQYGIQKYTRYKLSDSWSIWWYELIAQPQNIYVGATRSLKNIADLNAAVKVHGAPRYIRVYFDEGTYDDVQLNLQTSSTLLFYSTSGDKSKVTIGSKVVMQDNHVEFYNLTFTGAVQMHYNTRVYLNNCDFKSMYMQGVNVATVLNCTFTVTTATRCLDMTGVSYCAVSGCSFAGQVAASACIGCQNTYCTISGATSFSNANYALYSSANSYIIVGNTAQVTLNDIALAELAAISSSLIYAGPASATRTGTLPTVSTPAKGVNGNNNSYVMYQSTWHS